VCYSAPVARSKASRCVSAGIFLCTGTRKGCVIRLLLPAQKHPGASAPGYFYVRAPARGVLFDSRCPLKSVPVRQRREISLYGHPQGGVLFGSRCPLKSVPVRQRRDISIYGHPQGVCYSAPVARSKASRCVSAGIFLCTGTRKGCVKTMGCPNRATPPYKERHVDLLIKKSGFLHNLDSRVVWGRVRLNRSRHLCSRRSLDNQQIILTRVNEGDIGENDKALIESSTLRGGFHQHFFTISYLPSDLFRAIVV